MQAVYDDAVRVLAEVGVECRHREVAGRLESWGGHISNDRVLFRPERVREFVAANRRPPAPLEQGPVRLDMASCWAGIHYCDPLTLRVRRATSAEVAQMCRLWDARGFSGVVPVVPGDVPPEQETLTAEYVALTNSRRLGGSLTCTDPALVRLMAEMNRAVGRCYVFMDQVSISPLRFNASGLETALVFRDDPDVVLSLGGFIPMAGASCPLDPRSAAVQASAEAIAFAILCSALGQEGEIGLRIEPVDFQYSVIVFGSPEWCLYRALAVQMTEYLTGAPVRGGRFRSTAKQPDEHASCERAASALWQAMLGARIFGGTGQLSVDEVFSPQQAVLDREILRYVERVMNGIDFGVGPTDPLALIREGMAEGGFMAVADTAARFRDFYSFPDIFRHWNVGRWFEEGSPSVLQEAWSRAQEEIASCAFDLTREQRRDVDAIYRRALAYLGR
jgi:trimethylamine:corrinoid methyltransferase-like protein